MIGGLCLRMSHAARGFALALGLTALLVGGGAPAAGAGAGDGPAATDFVRDFGDRAVTLLSDDGLDAPGREAALRRLLSENFDVPVIGRFVLGRYWRTASGPERAEFAELFEEMIVATYARQLGNYAGETLDVVGLRQSDDRGAVVSSRILRASGSPIAVDWRLLRRGDGWRIVDVMVEGVSMALTQRAEFAAVIRSTGGVAGLLARLRTKVAQVETAAAPAATGLD